MYCHFRSFSHHSHSVHLSAYIPSGLLPRPRQCIGGAGNRSGRNRSYFVTNTGHYRWLWSVKTEGRCSERRIWQNPEAEDVKSMKQNTHTQNNIISKILCVRENLNKNVHSRQWKLFIEESPKSQTLQNSFLFQPIKFTYRLAIAIFVTFATLNSQLLGYIHFASEFIVWKTWHKYCIEIYFSLTSFETVNKEYEFKNYP